MQIGIFNGHQIQDCESGTAIKKQAKLKTHLLNLAFPQIVVSDKGLNFKSIYVKAIER